MSSSRRAEIVSRLRSAGCVFAEDEAELLVSAAATPAQLTTMIDQRVSGLPLEHIVGWVEFCGRRIAVDPGVFVPRQRTEFLVRQAVALAGTTDRMSAPTVVVDLCCGSGALGTALASLLPGVELYAADIDPTSVRCARRNIAEFDGQAFEGDLFEPLPVTLRRRIDLVLSNVPYVPTDAIALMPPEARLYEPREALDGGVDGLDILRRMAAEGADWLAPGGHVLVEASEEQASSISAVFAANRLAPQVLHSDELSSTVVVGTAAVQNAKRTTR